ncbi:RNA-directed DNA polymerase (Reverse transcriptase) [Trifolium medium]|uniref:RNA-directed DNA polymerase (Reverse transcriptase) n=1 Tax=Trifolium medium TaxID=97028 RepID=A0A392M0Y5_9FABA|nr:RNA-directed DNA polymerase (Reverse transcriptase) [Trifolium medium]
MVDAREAQCMKKILNDYERASGQAINYAKSKVFFSRNTPNNIKENVSNILGVTEVMGTSRYLGMTSMIGRNKKVVFGYLKDRMWKKVQSWSEKHLSKARREVLIKSVAQAIPAYCMNTILLPNSLGEDLERMINSFRWGLNKSSCRGINWLRWEKVAMRKEYGGMSFRHFYGFNLAMWNLGLINQLFNIWDATEIIKIPLSLTHQEDKLIWNYSKQDSVAVKRAKQGKDFSMASAAVQEVWPEDDCWQHTHGYLIDAIGFVPMVFKMIAEVDANTMSKVAMLGLDNLVATK